MPEIQYRKANRADIPQLSRIRSLEWGTEEYWNLRISGYMNHKLHPQKALRSRILFISADAGKVVGFIAGHLTSRLGCDGELEWINVIPEYRKKGISSELLRILAVWFVEKKALKICVDVDPENSTAQKFYRQHGAKNLNEHWLYWEDIGVVLEEGR